MSELKCNVCSCCHNNEKCCCLENINVTGSNACCTSETQCSSFSMNNCSCHNETTAPKSSVNIHCDVCNCVHNNNNLCNADHIDISGLSASDAKETRCSSFERK